MTGRAFGIILGIAAALAGGCGTVCNLVGGDPQPYGGILFDSAFMSKCEWKPTSGKGALALRLARFHDDRRTEFNARLWMNDNLPFIARLGVIHRPHRENRIALEPIGRRRRRRAQLRNWLRTPRSDVRRAHRLNDGLDQLEVHHRLNERGICRRVC